MNDIEQLQRRVERLERQLALFDFFSNMIIFKQKVQFKQNVYDKDGGVVTEINNI